MGGASVQREPVSPAGTSSLAQFTNGLGKKKPPPPPPPKRGAAAKPDEWVVALYPFTGQGGSDLSFEEGARIRVVKRTETDQDWYVLAPYLTIRLTDFVSPRWVGELNGVTGNFPANYCKPLE
jgi:hypothetical protein